MWVVKRENRNTFVATQKKVKGFSLASHDFWTGRTEAQVKSGLLGTSRVGL